MGSKSPLMILMMATLVCSIIPALGALLPPSAFAQQVEASLGEEEDDLAGSIVSNVLDDHNEVDQDNTAEQDAANLGFQDQRSAQDQDVDQDATQEDLDVQIGESVQQSQQQPPQTEPPPPPPEEDATPPVITVPEDMVVEATSEQGAVVTYEVTAQDDRDGTVPVECTPESGSIFPVGVTTVECTATDEAGNTATASFTVTVQDTTAPECSLEITADKKIYEPEDVVAITITNTGDVPIEFPDSFLGLEIRNVDTGEVFPLDAQPVVVTFAPGASATFQFTYEELVNEIGTGSISATVPSECTGTVEQVTFMLSAPPPPEEIVEKIAFSSDRDRNPGIYVMNTDGSNPQRLTNNGGGPNWSPDGTKIVFVSTIDGKQDIYVMDADGSNQQRLTNDAGQEFGPKWSPDGTKIVFYSNKDSFVHEIYVMNTDGSNVQRLTNNALDDIHPNWSPDGTKIVFSSTRPGLFSGYKIYVMNPDGSNQRSISPPTVENEYLYFPNWSPDGTKIAYSTSRHGGFEIYVMNTDGSNPQRLTNNPYLDIYPNWSPDGTKIVFETDRDEPNHNREIYVMNADGSNQHNISNNVAAVDAGPDWGPAADTSP